MEVPALLRFHNFNTGSIFVSSFVLPRPRVRKGGTWLGQVQGEMGKSPPGTHCSLSNARTNMNRLSSWIIRLSISLILAVLQCMQKSSDG